MGVHDILGIKPVGEAGLKVVEATVEGLSTFLGGKRPKLGYGQIWLR